MKRPAKRTATIVISDWLANCQVGQWTPFEAATALKEALRKECYVIVPVDQWLMPDPERSPQVNASAESDNG